MKKILGTLAIAAIAAIAAEPALAGQVSDMIENTGNQMQAVPVYINYVSYIIGVALAVAGIAKLKAHADNPGQTSIKDGIGRLLAATAFISLPYMLTVLRASSEVGTTGVNFQAMDAMT